MCVCKVQAKCQMDELTELPIPTKQNMTTDDWKKEEENKSGGWLPSAGRRGISYYSLPGSAPTDGTDKLWEGE